MTENKATPDKERGIIAKSRFLGIDLIKNTILDPTHKDSVWEEVSPTKVRLKLNIGLREKKVREIAGADFDKIWSILQQSQRRTKPISIRFTPKQYEFLRNVAKNEGKGFSTFVREAFLSYMENTAQHDQLMEELNTGNQEETGQTLADLIVKNNDLILKAFEQLHIHVDERLDKIEAKIEKEIFLSFYLGREVKQEDHARISEYAKTMVRAFLDGVDDGR